MTLSFRFLNGLVAAFTMTALAMVAAAQNAAPPSKSPEPAPAPAPAPTPPAATPALEYVLMTTSKGPIVIELNREKAPISVDNFLSYVDKGYYDGTVFHRVIPKFMIQGGGFDKDMKQKATAAPIKNEWQNGLKNARGSIAMARTAAADSATSQFYINVVDNTALDQPRGGAAYAVFGKVIGGMNSVDAIQHVATGQKPATALNNGQPTPTRMGDVPVEPVVIESVKRISAEEAKQQAAGSS